MDNVLQGGFVFEGMYHSSYTVNYTRDPQCQSHDPLDAIQLTDHGADDPADSERGQVPRVGHMRPLAGCEDRVGEQVREGDRHHGVVEVDEQGGDRDGDDR